MQSSLKRVSTRILIHEDDSPCSSEGSASGDDDRSGSKNFSGGTNRTNDPQEAKRKNQEMLVKAARAGDFKKAVTAVSEGADIFAKNLRGQTPLMLAAGSKNEGLLDPKATKVTPESERKASVGGSRDTVKFLLDAKADLEAKDDLGWNALHHACRNNRQETVDYLLNKGASIKTLTMEGETILMLAAMDSADDLVLYLLKQKANLDKKNEDGWTCLFFACKENRGTLVKTLLEKKANAKDKAKDGTTPLMLSASTGNVRSGKLLHKKGANLNATTARGVTALMIALQNSHQDFAEWLLEENASVAEESQDGLMAIDIAIMQGMTLMKNALDMKLRQQTEEVMNDQELALEKAKRARALADRLSQK